MHRPLARALTALATTALATAAALGAPGVGAATATAAGTGSASLAATTGVGVHNAYQQATFPYFADALDSGAALLEIDVWTDDLTGRWRVNHELFGRSNNCEGATTAAELRTRARNQDFGGCLADIRAWHDANPGHRPIIFKIEMKDGFNSRYGLGPTQFDALISRTLGDAVFTPADLLARPGGGAYATPDEAALAGNWPSRDALAGKVIFEIIPGTVEEGNPLDSLWSDVEYATHLRALASAGRLADAQAFPAVHGAAAGDPRTRYADAALRPWFVFFDGDAAAYLTGGIDTAWYRERGYLLVMTSAHAVSPAISATNPTSEQAAARAAELAAAGASVLTSDWSRLPQVLSTVLPRG
ncbi:phosphatidylinositol-specific phospholipase C domain-containing protein [Allostreptomyces psammosilenae]|uniref:Uncharacterized protein n=1 Tax=Allostreptomyces psammosilenae TaxID=1892865 RepID=A0A853A0W5_9ACTN|nr:phosphatidylinositol-specific phospholipase C domain-containing protein [Allostreptomyces psammosilenae]NYI08206.1 hypothetical protein [Allostreptomyces psammosilenae]